MKTMIFSNRVQQVKGLFILFSFISVMMFDQASAQQFNIEKTRIKTKGMYNSSMNVYPMEFYDFDNDGDNDLLASNDFGHVLLENIGTSSSPEFESAKHHPFGLKGMLYITYADIDNDGDLDAFGTKMNGVSTFKCRNAWCENTGTKSAPQFGKPVDFECGLSEDLYYRRFVDIDGDGDLDMFGIFRTGLGVKDSRVVFQENTGTANKPQFSELVYAPFGLIEFSTATINFADIDKDGDFDAYFTASTKETGKNVFVQWNNGNAINAEFSDPETGFTDLYISFGENIFVDINGDGTVENIFANDTGLFYQTMKESRKE